MSDEPGRVSTFDRAVKFVCEMWNHDGPGSEMHVGDLAWGTFHCWPSALAALRLWTDRSGRIQALTMFDGTGVCDLVVRPGDAGLEAAALALNWAEAERTSAAIGPEPVELRVGRRLQSPGLVELLDVRGFARLRSGAPAMSRTITATDVDRPSIPDGYEIREIRTEDLASRVHAFDAAFPGEALSVDAYRALRGCSAYVPSLDIVAMSSANSVAAFATLWLDAHNSVVQIEPAGCQPDHRRRGLTRAVILHALSRSVELGAAGALVRHVSTNEAARALYQACGFLTVSEQTGFVKTLDGRDVR
jgi:ribosomal protein S18 acetylase RimI-like enzyme